MTSLRETQKILWQLITAPEGVAKGLAELEDPSRVLPEGLEGLVRSDERLSAVERLDVYANMYFFRILDCLKEDFPAVRATVGETHFHNLVTGYLIDHPSTHPSLRWAGRHLPAFLDANDLGRERPWLSDLARLEWAILDAFDAPDAEPLAPERLEALPPERWAEARIRLSPSLRIVAVASRVDTVWATAMKGGEVADPAAEATAIRVWRRDLRVLHRAVDAPEAAALGAVVAGEDFANVCAAVAALTSLEAAPLAATEILQRWFADGLVVGLDTTST